MKKKLRIGFILIIACICIYPAFALDKQNISGKDIKQTSSKINQSALQEDSQTTSKDKAVLNLAIQKTALSAAQKSFDRTLNIFSWVITVAGIIVALIAIIIGIATAFNIFETRKAKILRKDAEDILQKAKDEARDISEIKSKMKDYLANIRKDIPSPDIAQEISAQVNENLSEFSNRLDLLEIFGIPIKADDLINRGVYFGSKEDWVSALKNFQKAYELEPDNIVALLNMAVAYRCLLNWEKNTEAIDRAMKINPNDWRVWVQKGISLSENKLFEEAITVVKKAIELKPDDSDILNTLVTVLLAYGSLDEAQSTIDKALEINPKNAGAIYNLACLHSLRGNKEGALEKLKICIEMKPKYKEHAKEDKDFENLWQDDEFNRITS